MINRLYREQSGKLVPWIEQETYRPYRTWESSDPFEQIFSLWKSWNTFLSAHLKSWKIPCRFSDEWWETRLQMLKYEESNMNVACINIPLAPLIPSEAWNLKRKQRTVRAQGILRKIHRKSIFRNNRTAGQGG